MSPFRSTFHLFIIATIISCNLNDRLEDGKHKAFVTEYNTETKKSRDFAAEVIVTRGVVKEILNPEGETIDDFDFWETKSNVCQDAYTSGPNIYTTYLINEEN